MKKTTFILSVVMAVAVSNQSMAQGLLSNFSLVKGETYQCPVRLKVTRDDKKILISVGNSLDMQDGGVFQNNMIYTDINSGWIVTEVSPAGEFSNKTELLINASQASLSYDEKLVNNGLIKRHTKTVFIVTDDETATLKYQIIKLEKGMTASGYSSFECNYKQGH